jgi:hypothetical protein
MGNKKAVIIVGVLAVAVIVGFVALRGTWPPGQGTEGAIGAANRYSSQQITANDVKLQDADIQAFIQSDLFHKLATNTEFRNMVKEASFRDVAANASYQAIVENKAQAQSLGNKDFASYLAKPTTVAMVTNEAFVKVASECNLAEALKSPKFFELVSKTLDSKSTPAQFAKELGRMAQAKELDHTFVEYAAKNAGDVLAAMTPTLLEAKNLTTSLSGAAELLANPKLGQLLEAKPKPFTELVTMEAHEELMKNPTIMSMAFQSDAFQKIVETGAWSELEKGFTTIDQ